LKYHYGFSHSGTSITLIFTLGLLDGLIAWKMTIPENRLLTNLGYSKTLIKNLLNQKTTFAPDNKDLDNIVESLPLQAYREYNSLSFQTEPTNEINIIYSFNDNYNRSGSEPTIL